MCFEVNPFTTAATLCPLHDDVWTNQRLLKNVTIINKHA